MKFLNNEIINRLVKTLLFSFLTLFVCGKALGASATLTSVYVSFDGQIVTNTIGGTNVVQTKPGFNYIYYKVPGTFSHDSNTPVYVHVTYYDADAGFIQMQYDATGNAYKPTETHTRSTRVNTGKFVDSYHQLQTPVLGGHENGGADLRLNIDNTNTVFSVAGVVIQDKPFTNAQLQLDLSKPWLSAYTGLTRTDAVDASSMTDKVMCGYQGWFNTPNDPADGGWLHWCRNGIMDTNHFNTDMWPDMSQYSTNDWFQAGNVKTRSGQTAYVFSDASPGVVEVQFQWMRKYNIDGVFLQRFLKSSTLASAGHQEWALANVRAAANAEGRIWAIEYDASSLDEGNAYTYLTNDWMWMVDTFKIKQDPRYAHNGNKPVVGFFGLGDPGRNNITVATCNRILDWFKTNATYGGNYIWGAPPTDWLSEWTANSSIYQKYDAISPWHSSNYGADIMKASTWGAAYWPILWPGFSWSNEQTETNTNSTFKDRNGGTFFWTKAHSAITNAGVNCLFIGMFDEYDEGTAIMPMSDDPPQSPSGSYGGAFIDNEGKPSDWWLFLAGEAKAEMFGQRPNSLTLPSTLELTNRSNIGPEVDDTLQTSDAENRLYRVPVAFDGNTSVETQAGRSCRYNTNPGTDRYFYFNVDDNFSYQTTKSSDTSMTVEVEYYDASGDIPFTLQYDSTNGSAYVSNSKTVTTQGTGRWRNARFQISDAYFGNRENDGTDFRIFVKQSGAKLDISRVWVRKDELKYQAWNINDVGNVGIAGDDAIEEITDTYTLDGAGTDIFGNLDSFAFVNQPLNGDGQIIARVNSVENTDLAAKAGVMIRLSLAADSPTVAVVVTPGNGICYLVRSTTGGSIVQTTVTNLVAPYWVKVTRSGNVFNGYCSPDGTHWMLIGTDTVSMPANALIGLAATSKVNDTLNTSIFQYVSVSLAVNNVYNNSPVFAVDLQPANVDCYAGTSNTFSVTVSGSQPIFYQWYLDDSPIAGATNASYTFAALPGTNTYYCYVTNSLGSANSSTATVVGIPVPVINTSNYTSSLEITFSGYNRTETLRDFPVLVRLGTNVPGFSYAQFALPTGADLRFTEAEGTREIPYEINQWNPDGISTVWVQVPALSSTNDSIRAYWGNPEAVAPDYTTNGDVWLPPAFESLPSFDLVYHLEQSGFPYFDSTLQYPATNGIAPGLTNGLIGLGGSFTRLPYLDAGPIDLGSAFTVSAWINPSGISDEQGICGNGISGFNNPGFKFFVNTYQTGDGSLNLLTGNGSAGTQLATGAGAVSVGQWHLVTAVVNHDGGVAQLYVDGDLQASGAIRNDFPDATNNVNIGQFTDGSFQFLGLMDETRIQSGLESSNWVWASWMTVAQNAAFENYSTVTNIATSAVLNFHISGGGMTLDWSQGTLQSADQVQGPYTDVLGAAPPYAVSFTQTQKFYRVKIQ